MNNPLIHYGILGMKWGIRRYQNPDGSLTGAGKRRYSKRLDTVNSFYAEGARPGWKKERDSLQSLLDKGGTTREQYENARKTSHKQVIAEQNKIFKEEEQKEKENNVKLAQQQKKVKDYYNQHKEEIDDYLKYGPEYIEEIDDFKKPSKVVQDFLNMDRKLIDAEYKSYTKVDLTTAKKIIDKYGYTKIESINSTQRSRDRAKALGVLASIGGLMYAAIKLP